MSFDCDQLPSDVREDFLVGCLHELTSPNRADLLAVREMGVAFGYVEVGTAAVRHRFEQFSGS